MIFLISLSRYVAGDEFERTFILIRAMVLAMQMAVDLSLVYYVRMLKGEFEAMIPEKVSEGRMGLIKRVRPISRDDDRPAARWFWETFAPKLCMNIGVFLIFYRFTLHVIFS